MNRDHRKQPKLIAFAGADPDPNIAMARTRWAKRQATKPQSPTLIQQIEEMLSGIPPRRRCLIAGIVLSRCKEQL